MWLAGVYILNELRTVRARGSRASCSPAARRFGWSDLVAANPRNRDRLLALGDEEFERVMVRWLDAYIPKPNEAIPGVADYEFEEIKVPTLIVRRGENDFDHPPRPPSRSMPSSRTPP